MVTPFILQVTDYLVLCTLFMEQNSTHILQSLSELKVIRNIATSYKEEVSLSFAPPPFFPLRF